MNVHNVYIDGHRNGRTRVCSSLADLISRLGGSFKGSSMRVAKPKTSPGSADRGYAAGFLGLLMSPLTFLGLFKTRAVCKLSPETCAGPC